MLLPLFCFGWPGWPEFASPLSQQSSGSLIVTFKADGDRRFDVQIPGVTL